MRVHRILPSARSSVPQQLGGSPRHYVRARLSVATRQPGMEHLRRADAFGSGVIGLKFEQQTRGFWPVNCSSPGDPTGARADIFVNVPPRVCLTLADHTHGGQFRMAELRAVPLRCAVCIRGEPPAHDRVRRTGHRLRAIAARAGNPAHRHRRMRRQWPRLIIISLNTSEHEEGDADRRSERKCHGPA
jgi:hypothetical protein